MGVKVLPSIFLNELRTRAAIRDFSNLCGMQLYNVEKSYVCTDVAARTSNWSSNDNRHVEFFSIHMLFTALRLILVLQYLISSSLTVDSNFVRRHGKSSVWRHQ